MILEELDSVQFPLANRFFKANGHKGKARSDERVLILRDNGNIVAALRACPKKQGYLLRSVWVAINRRGEGLGSLLTEKALKRLNSDCWCYPYPHLQSFYENTGFSLQETDQVPEDIAVPFENYRNKGESFLLMAFSQR
ncbi:hypothetical protein EOPP23_17910 [Endozoicomonas sp. OPT23]|uniref:GNAT family N-acetyltransferase n=1 Tax=Endozoicomonas sp. OPT23 TaxID=2072845 RepID=UPI00129A28B3|nr:GNAT family N-acetyltransferase [Endozoicomonas sp. OPT23]MRI34856.1 hypothetical protein [Endozoicomonas sp. OPT23]